MLKGNRRLYSHIIVFGVALPVLSISHGSITFRGPFPYDAPMVATDSVGYIQICWFGVTVTSVIDERLRRRRWLKSSSTSVGDDRRRCRQDTEPVKFSPRTTVIRLLLLLLLFVLELGGITAVTVVAALLKLLVVTSPPALLWQSDPCLFVCFQWAAGTFK